MAYLNETYNIVYPNLGQSLSTRAKTTQHCSEIAVSSTNNGCLVPHTITNATSTTSSSQTETNIFLPKAVAESPQTLKANGQEHINANVVRIQLGSKDIDSKIEEVANVHRRVKSSFSEASSSIPSSYEKTCDQTVVINSPAMDSKVDLIHQAALNPRGIGNDHMDDDLPPLKKPMTIQIPQSPNHNRERRGGIIPNKSDNDQLAKLNRLNYSRNHFDMESFSPGSCYPNTFAVPSAKTMVGTTLEELEIKSGIAQTNGSINAKLQSMPDSIIRISISTPSS